ILLLLALSFAAVSAQQKSADGYYTTGQGVRVKKILFAGVNVYWIKHEIKEIPADKTPSGLVNADVDKRFVMQMLRDVESDKIVGAIREAYTLNGFGDAGRVNALWAGVIGKGELKKDDIIVINYIAASKTVSIWYGRGGQGRGSSAAGGIDLMKGTWSIWFGNIDQPDLKAGLSRM
ncbi:MAG: hypothetical protein HY042_02905, partial [Spirochaetia bacterium]|nr:hypothetical protein [Spirochaetia bacterium]